MMSLPECCHHVQADSLLVVVVILHDADVEVKPDTCGTERQFQLRNDVNHEIVFQVACAA